MRRFALSVSLSLAALAAFALPARADFSDTDGSLRAELESREEALAGATDAAGKKQYKAVVKALAFMDKAADDLGDDIKTAGKVQKTLAKAFPEEFTLPTVEIGLRDLCLFLFQDLQNLLEGNLEELEDGLGKLSPKGQAKVGSALEAAAASMDAIDSSDLPAWAKLLAKAYKSWAKGHKTAESDPGPPVGVSITVDGKAFKPDADTTVVVINEIAGLLVFTANKVGLPAYNLSVTPGAVFGTGSKGISIASWNVIQLPPKNYAAEGGTFEVTAFDSEANTITFNFSFTASGVSGTVGTVAVSGSYSGPYSDGSE